MNLVEPAPSIYQRLGAHARRDPARPAILFDRQRLTYAELLAAVDEFRGALAGQATGNSVALCRHSAPETLVAFLAAASLGYDAQVLNPEWPEAIIQQTLAMLRPGLVIRNALPPAPGKPLADERRAAVTAASGGRSGEVPFYTGFTSGSTGLPKGFRRSERSWLMSFQADQELLELTADDTVLVFGSLAHSLFLYAAVRGLYAGAAIILHDRFRPDRVLDTIEAAHASVIFAVPTQLDALARAAGSARPSLRLAVSTGSSLPASAIASLSSMFPRAKIIECYGTSELSFVSAYTASGQEAEGFVGWPLKGVEVLIRDANGEPCPAGVTGDVHVASPFLFMGYAGRGDGPSRGEPFCVGDRGFLDETGGLHLVGRSDRMFQSSGRNIVPEEIEKALEGIAGVAHAAVIGQPDPSRGNRIVAIVDLFSPVERRALVAQLRATLPAYAIPGLFLQCHDWPLTASHKTDFQTLKTWLGAGCLKEL